MSSSSKPNVLVFFTDQQRWDSVGMHGNGLDVTPNFDRLARAGRFVPNSFTAQPVCGPARSMFQTGKYPTTTGCFRNDIPLPAGEKTLAHHFGAAGYHTAYIGKWHLASQEPVPRDQQGGYDYWLGANILEFTSFAYQTRLFDRDGEPHDLPGYRVDALTDAAIRHLAEPRDDPFFMFLSFLEPHHQNQDDSYPAPVGYEERLAKRATVYPPDLDTLKGNAKQHYHGYMGMIARLDEALGRIVDALISLGQLDNTIILFTSDHGCHFRTRNAEYKRSCHEASIRVPTLFHGPGFNDGTAISRICSLVDLPPTLLHAAGIEVPDDMQGTSLLAEKSGPDDMFVQISESQVARALRHGKWKYCISADHLDPFAHAGSDRYRESELYDLEADPGELNNLIAVPSHSDTRAMLAKRLVERMVEAGETAPRIDPAKPPQQAL
ncbi:sulfatase-like hydrolase/transferase [Oceaniglobus ichthyenteri]|uniref:sulfatase-like hydrolase/transferase n=1 Tax=Oceaniglobus ichthyenteri TaxID=2136177 RepID=UPI000D3A726A|nr:sulfatase-like hydrolase/transferase [Oceaniglobus ichthyenteri]